MPPKRRRTKSPPAEGARQLGIKNFVAPVESERLDNAGKSRTGTPIVDEEDPELAHAIALSKEQEAQEQRERWADFSTSGNGGGPSKPNHTIVLDRETSLSEQTATISGETSHTGRKSSITYSNRKRGRSPPAKEKADDAVSSVLVVAEKPSSTRTSNTSQKANQPFKVPDTSPTAAKPTTTEPTSKSERLLEQSTTPVKKFIPVVLPGDPVNDHGDDLVVTDVKSAAPASASRKTTTPGRPQPSTLERRKNATIAKPPPPPSKLDTIWTEEQRKERCSMFLESLYLLYGLRKGRPTSRISSTTPLIITVSSEPKNGTQGKTSRKRRSESPEARKTGSRTASRNVSPDPFDLDFELDRDASKDKGKGKAGGSVVSRMTTAKEGQTSKFFDGDRNKKNTAQHEDGTSKPTPKTSIPRGKRPKPATDVDAGDDLRGSGPGTPVPSGKRPKLATEASTPITASKEVTKSPKSGVSVRYGRIVESSSEEDDDATQVTPSAPASRRVSVGRGISELLKEPQASGAKNVGGERRAEGSGVAEERNRRDLSGGGRNTADILEMDIFDDEPSFESVAPKEAEDVVMEDAGGNDENVTPSGRRREKISMLQVRKGTTGNSSAAASVGGAKPAGDSTRRTSLPTSPETQMTGFTSPMLDAASPILVSSSQFSGFDPDLAKTQPAVEDVEEVEFETQVLATPVRKGKGRDGVGSTRSTQQSPGAGEDVEMAELGLLGITPSESRILKAGRSVGGERGERAVGIEVVVTSSPELRDRVKQTGEVASTPSLREKVEQMQMRSGSGGGFSSGGKTPGARGSLSGRKTVLEPTPVVITPAGTSTRPTKTPSKVPCPMCGKFFDASKIEGHAARCGEEEEVAGRAGAGTSKKDVWTVEDELPEPERRTDRQKRLSALSALKSMREKRKADEAVARVLEGEDVSEGEGVEEESPLRGKRRKVGKGAGGEMVQCPICQMMVDKDELEKHVNEELAEQEFGVGGGSGSGSGSGLGRGSGSGMGRASGSGSGLGRGGGWGGGGLVGGGGRVYGGAGGATSGGETPAENSVKGKRSNVTKGSRSSSIVDDSEDGDVIELEDGNESSSAGELSHAHIDEAAGGEFYIDGPEHEDDEHGQYAQNDDDVPFDDAFDGEWGGDGEEFGGDEWGGFDGNENGGVDAGGGPDDEGEEDEWPPSPLEGFEPLQQ
ncbi:hypothetical protein HDV00_000241, partial [Rhizophlyctis rosea]